MSDTPRLFVYGTLRGSRVFDNVACFLGPAVVQGRLVPLGEYMAMVAEPGAGIVRGELYEIEPRAWEELMTKLDRYEGCAAEDPEPHQYARRLVTAQLNDGERHVTWAYVLNSP